MNCPCCGEKLLPHCNHHQGLYWDCLSCRQTMPVIPKCHRNFKNSNKRK